MKQQWRTVRLGDLLKIQNGFAFSSKQFSTNEGIPLVRIRSLKSGTENETFYSGAFDEQYLVNAGDLLIGMDGEFGCYEWKGSTALLNQRVCRLQDFNEELLPRFLYYGINSHLKAIESATGFTTVKHLSSSTILNIEFPVPPLDEQQRIVRLLDAAFDGIAIAKANAEKNLDNARALFERHLQAVFSQDTDQWHIVPLAEISSIESGAGFPLRYQGLEAERYPFYKVGDMNSTGNERWLRLANHMVSDVTRKKLGAHLFPAGTIVFPKVGGAINTNKKRIASTDCCIDNNCFGVSPTVTLVNADLLYYWFRSIKLAEFANDAALPSITKTTLSSWPVAMPTQRQEQDRIVESLAQLEQVSGTLIDIAEKKLSLIKQLSRALLSQAFNGDVRAA